MNINGMIQKINNFNASIVDTGFLRDIQEYINAIGQPQNSQNLLLLKDITTKTLQAFRDIMNSDIQSDLKKLIPTDPNVIFTKQQYLDSLEQLLANPQITTAEFHSQLTQILSTIRNEITNNQQSINNLKNMLIPYYEAESKLRAENNNAVISLIFKESTTISNLKHFSKALEKWNRAIYLYHQLVSRTAPKDIELVNIENGSLDVILNIDVNVAINFTEIVGYGLKAFAAYLLYKTKTHEIVQAYFGNKKLIDSEKEREKELLKNIGITIKTKLIEQHEQIIKEMPEIKPDGKEKIAEEVSKIIAEHLVAGNDIKLLMNDSGDGKIDELKNVTNRESLKVRNGLKQLDMDDKKLLLETYILKSEEE